MAGRAYDRRHPPGHRPQLVFEDVVLELLGVLWGYRLESVGILGVGAIWYVGSDRLGAEFAGLLLAVGVAAVVLVSPLRRPVDCALHVAGTRRAWSRACHAAGLAMPDDQIPRARSVRRVPAGEIVSVAVPSGANATKLEDARETLAACLGLREVRVTRDPRNASLAEVTLVRRDTLAAPGTLLWPHRCNPRLSLWAPIPVGVDENGEVVHMTLPEHNVLLGGEPGAGKSVALSALVATAALDPSCRLWLLDGKLVELAAWAPCAERSIGVSVEEANQVLRELQGEMEDRYRQLLFARRRKVAEGDPWPLEVVVCDELAHYLSAPDRKQRTEFAELMRDLVSRGRAAGVIVLAATQKPSHDVIPTSLRDLFGFRWALRCSTPQASDTILGAGWASQDFTASSIDASSRGVGLLLHEGRQPIRLRSFQLSDSDIDAIALRAEDLRSRTEQPTG